MTVAPNISARLLATGVLMAAAASPLFTQTPTAADGPWSGQMQCVLSARGPNYQDDQTHTWRIIPGQPVLNGVFRQWPAVWTVQGSGNRLLPTGTPETWNTAVPETNAPLAFAVNTVTNQLRIGSQHGLLSINGAITGRTTTAGGTQTPIVAGIQEWPFPILDDVATATTMSGTRTRNAPNGFGWRQPAGVPTTETCTWNFSKTPAQAQVSSAATGTNTATAASLRSAGPVTGIQSTAPTPTSDTTRNKQAFGDGDARAAVVASLAIKVTYPNGGETLNVGTPVTIQWSHLLTINTMFTADVSYDGGATWTPTNSSTNTTSGTGSLSWTVSGNATTRARIRLRTTDGAYADLSDADFTIASTSGTGTTSSTGTSSTTCTGTCTVQVTSPNGGETWTFGVATPQPYRLTWTSTYPSTQSFDVNFSADGGASWTRVARTTGTGVTFGAAATSAGTQFVPPITERAQFNVTPVGQPGGDTSDAPFHIRKPVVVTSPNGGETLTIGSQATITYTWAYTSQNGYIPALQVSYDGGTTWVDERDAQTSTVTNNAGQATAQWRVLGPAATRVRARIAAVVDARLGGSGGGASDESDADFTIVDSSTPSTTGTVQVTSPNGGETWTFGVATPQPYRLTWTSTYPSTQSFDVNFSADGGASWTRVARTTGTGVTFGAAATSAGTQFVPPITERAQFNVTPVGQPGGDTSDAPFHIRKPVVVTSPNGGETLTIGSQATITYTWAYTSQNGYIPALQVSYDGGTTWVDERDAQTSTVTNNAGQATAQWRVLGPAATRVRARIAAVVDARLGGSGGGASDESDADFTIVDSSTPSTTGTVQVTSPNGGETWTFGVATPQPYRLTWTSTYPSTQSFDVNFSADGGASWTRVARTTGTGVTFGAAATSAGTQFVPPITERAQFNVTPVGQPGGDTSDAPFHIRKPVVVTSPNGGETLTIGSQATITYTWAYTSQNGYIPALQVSYDGGTTWVDERDAQTSTVTNNAGQATAQWRVLGPAATRARVRINAVVDPRLGSASGVASSDESDADFTIVSAP